MTIGTVTDKKQPDNKYVKGDEVMNIYSQSPLEF